MENSLNKEDAEKWLDYRRRGIKPTRYKLKAIVFSDNGFKVATHFKLNGYEMSLKPLPAGHEKTSLIENLMPAFICEVIADYQSHRGGNNFDLHECLDRVMPLIGFKYRLSLNYSQWEEYEGAWIEAISGGGSASVQKIHGEIPKANIHSIVAAYEAASNRQDKRSKKAAMIRSRLKEALELEGISNRFSFLSYYNILEIVSDDIASSKSITSGSATAKDIANFSLSTKGSQRTKLYFLIHARENEFDINQVIKLADVRNDLAHGELSVEWAKLDLCKKIAFWASEQFILTIEN